MGQYNASLTEVCTFSFFRTEREQERCNIFVAEAGDMALLLGESTSSWMMVDQRFYILSKTCVRVNL